MIYFRLIVIWLIVLIAGIIDNKTRKIPNALILTGIITATIFDIFLMPISLSNMGLKWICVIFLFFLGMLRLMGFGDMKLWMVMSLYYGLLHSSLIIGFAAIIFIFHHFVTDKSARRIVFLSVAQIFQKDTFKVIEQKSYPFGPYIAIATSLYTVLVIGKEILL